MNPGEGVTIRFGTGSDVLTAPEMFGAKAPDSLANTVFGRRSNSIASVPAAEKVLRPRRV
jgi:hypothetical protein